jgi:hypothetical protein
MSDAVRCGKCGYVYSTRWNENWGVCLKCGTNNDALAWRRPEDPEPDPLTLPRVVSYDHIHTTITKEQLIALRLKGEFIC